MRFDAAPLDRAARIGTALVWVLAALLLAGGAFALQRDASVAAAVVLGSGGLLAAAHAWIRRIEPTAYVVEDGALQVERRSAGPRRLVGPLANVRRGALGWRVAGDGGAYGYLGRFRAEGRTVSAYVTNRAKVVLLEVGDRALALSPDDPDRFVESVGRGR